MFFDQLKKACGAQNTTPTAIVRKLGLSSGQVTAWKNGTIPKISTVEMLANELNVPIAFFFGVEQPEPLPDDELELIDVYRQLSRSGKRQLLGKAYELLDTQPQQRPGEEVSPPNVSVVTAVHNSGIKK